MKNLSILAATLALLSLSACATITDTMAEAKGISATDCFTQGGTIKTEGDASMCVMGEESKPIL